MICVLYNHSVHWGITPPLPLSKTPPPLVFFVKPPPPPLNLQTVQAPFLGYSPLYIGFSWPLSPLSKKDFSVYFLCKTCSPPEKSPPLKIEILSSSPFWKFVSRLNPLAESVFVEGGAHYDSVMLWKISFAGQHFSMFYVLQQKKFLLPKKKVASYKPASIQIY